MLTYRALRSIFEGRLQESVQAGGDGAAARGRLVALQEFHDTLGVQLDIRGFGARPTFAVDERGRPHKLPNSARADEVSIRNLAESICGHEFVEEYFHPGSGFEFRQLSEAALDPTAFLNINTFNLAVAGLVNAAIIEGFENPAYIGDQFVTVVPTKMNGEKLIGVTKIGPQTSTTKGRMPGEAHSEVGFGEQYKTTPETVEQALKCKVTREVVFFDLTGQVVDNARNGIGDELSYGREKTIADLILGVTNNYNFMGTSYNTYQTSSPWINDHSNPFTDELDIDEARQLFVNMTDPITGREILVNGLEILCMPARELKFREQMFGSNVQIGTQLNSNFPSRVKFSSSAINSVGGGTYTLTPLTSVWYNRATASDGLNLSASNAKEYWWCGDFKRAVQVRENWPLTPWQASAEELTMKDHGLVAVFGANYRIAVYMNEPRYIVRNKN